MALSTLAKEQENFLRYAILIVDHTKEALQDLIELNLKNKHLTFEEFLNQNQHEIYHLCYDFRCCQCLNTPPRRKRILIPPQLELLFDKYKKLPSHKGTSHNDFCCSYAKVGITSQVLDLSLARCLLVNCCLDVFWYTCLTSQDQTLEKFLNSNKHIIYHLWKNNQNCCQCASGFIFPCDRSIITEHEWKSMFSSRLSPCENDRKRMSTGSSSVCSVGATPGIDTQDINTEVQRFILQKCSHISKAVDFLVEQRNSRFAHVPEARIPDSDFRLFLKDIENHLLGIARVCGKETHVKKILRDLHLKPLSLNMLKKYEKQLNQNTEAINKNNNLQHRTTRQSIPKLVDKSTKIRKIEKRVDALENSVAKITEEVKDLSKIIKEQSKRQRLLDQTTVEIETHESEGTYVEVGAVKHCVQLLESRNVVILSGREGSGKSRNGLEILKQLKEKNKDFDVFKLIRLNYVSDIVNCNVKSVILFDDAFHKTCEQFSNDKQILEQLCPYISHNKVKVIFTMRNTVKHACNKLLSTHRLFHDWLDIDLNSEKFQLTTEEKEKILTNYCDINKITIFERVGDTEEQSVFREAGIDDTETNQTVSEQVSVFVKREVMNEIVQTDPFLGYPECCRLFTENRNKTTLDAAIFKWPSHTLVKDIEKWRFEGDHDFMKGLKYVALVYILTVGRYDDINEYYLASDSKTICSLQGKNIDLKVCKEILKECCNKNSEVYEHDIKNALDELVAGCYLVRKNGTYYFQHPALEDTILVSYSKINTKAIIPLLSFDHMMDLVRLQNYIEQENEIFVKIQKKYYNDLAIHFISLICHTYDIGQMECSTFSKNDIDFIHQLLICFNDKSESSLMLESCDNEVSHYFPLCLLQNIGELNDNKLTANHTKDKLLISMVIEGQTITFIVDPTESLHWAFQDKNERIIIWLAKNTDHSLLKLEILLYEYILYTNFGSIPLLLQNFDHDQFDMTDLLSYVCIDCFNKENHIIDWMMENINNSLIDYDTMFINFIFNESFDLEDYFNLILYIRNKVNRKLFDVSKAVQMWYIYRGTEIVQRVLQDDNWSEISRFKQLVGVASERGWLNVLELLFKHDTNKSFHTDKVIEDALQQLGNGAHCEKTFRLIMKYYVDYIDVNILMEKAIDVGYQSVVEELLLKTVDNISYHLDTTLNKLMSHQTCYFTRYSEKIVEQLLLATGVEYSNLSKFVGVTFRRGWFNVLELLFKQDIDKSFSTDKVIKDALQQLGNGTHCEKTIRLIIKYYLDYIDVNILMEKAVEVGCHSVVEELLLKKVDNISYLLDITLDKLRHQQLSYGFKILERDHRKILLLLLQKNNTKLIDLNSIMNDVCHIGHSPAIKWLLENKPSFPFDIRKVMHNACFRGDLELVDYLFQKYSDVDFDY
ncbi:Hypothetical predicted protein [Mytilus galloprovincialis]|uniref:Novel STAND NTPase 3 domain-containing protein n=1 Tax=Mytilus galloprovincialis TaxID=29158 RepID=A0A8B6G3G7_MYTGA|nr:Hypothetical predicted protein [Mytilus galloprovincialis]